MDDFSNLMTIIAILILGVLLFTGIAITFLAFLAAMDD